jgi:hypothetical protein
VSAMPWPSTDDADDDDVLIRIEMKGRKKE